MQELFKQFGSSAETIGTAFGIAAGMGVIFQICFMRQEDDPKIKRALKRGYEWLVGWKYRYFTQAEVAKFVELLDRYAGSRLWSRKRWLFALKVVGISCAIGLVWVLAFVVLAGFKFSARGEDDLSLLAVVPLFVLLLIPSFSVSLSLTKLIARVASALTTSRLTSALAFALLLVVHVALFVLWAPSLYIAMVLILAGPFALFADDASYLTTAISGAPEVFWGLAFAHESLAKSFGGVASLGELIALFMLVTKMVVDFAANGVRVGFALIALGSYLAPAVQLPIVNAMGRLLSPKMNDALLIGVVTGSIVGVIAFFYEAVRWISMGVNYLR